MGKKELGMVVYAVNPSPGEVGADELSVSLRPAWFIQ